MIEECSYEELTLFTLKGGRSRVTGTHVLRDTVEGSTLLTSDPQALIQPFSYGLVIRERVFRGLPKDTAELERYASELIGRLAPNSDFSTLARLRRTYPPICAEVDHPRFGDLQGRSVSDASA